MLQAEEKLWDHFHRYHRAAYASDSRFMADAGEWHGALRQRRERGEDIRLSFVEAAHESTGRKFQAFSINEQFFVSRDPAVLTLPHVSTAKDPRAVSSDQYVGVWVHDFGTDDRFVASCRAEIVNMPRYETSIARPINGNPVARKLGAQINAALAEPDLPGGYVNHIEAVRLHLAAEHPRVSGHHRDTTDISDAPGLPGIAETAWHRVLIYCAFGAPTVFALDGAERKRYRTLADGRQVHVSEIGGIRGSVSSHAGTVYNSCREFSPELGAFHRAERCAQGRGIVIFEDTESRETIMRARSPWHITSLSPG